MSTGRDRRLPQPEHVDGPRSTSLSVTTLTQVSHNRYEKSLILLSTHTVYAPEVGAITDGGLVNECIYIHQITSI